MVNQFFSINLAKIHIKNGVHCITFKKIPKSVSDAGNMYHVAGLVHHKPINTEVPVIYDIQCPDCNQHHIGETTSPLGIQIKEHLS